MIASTSNARVKRLGNLIKKKKVRETKIMAHVLII